MKCKLTVACPSPNPEFSAEDQVRAIQNGEHYDVPHTIMLPVGHAIEDPKAWILCVETKDASRGLVPPKAVPADDACRAKVRAWNARLPERIRQLDQMLRTAKPKSREEAEHLKGLRKTYAEPLYELDPDRYPLEDAEKEDKDDTE